MIINLHIAITNITELAFDPFEAVSDTWFELIFHGKNIIRCNSLLPFNLRITWRCKSISFAAWSIENVRIWLVVKIELARKWRWVLREWLALLHYDQSKIDFENNKVLSLSYSGSIYTILLLGSFPFMGFIL